MLKIRPEQMEPFQPMAERAFVQEVAEYLRHKHADTIVRLPKNTFAVKDIPRETLQEMVQSGIGRAREYGISWRSTLKAFVVLMFETAPNFDECPLIRQVLLASEIPPNLRIESLWEKTTEEDWKAVEQDYDADAWGLAPRQGVV
jgi:hypothetical protein